jgi:hypothetical protein
MDVVVVLDDSTDESKADQLRHLQSRIRQTSGDLPSVCFYTFLNSHKV